MEIQPTIFLSYSSKNKTVANKVDNTFSAIGISITRDERDLAFKGSIEEFMKQATEKHDYTMMLISDDYLKSEYCLFEAGEVLKSRNFMKKVLPVALANTNFFSPQSRKVYYQYWDEKIKAAETDFAMFSTEDFANQLEQFRKLRDIIADLFVKLHDYKLITFDQLEALHYKPLFQLIGIDENGLLQKCIQTLDIEDEEEQLIALDELQAEYRENQEVAFLKAMVYIFRNRLKVARKFCEDYIKKYDYDVHTVHFNLGNILENEYKDLDGAMEQYKKAISIKPDYALAHNNLGTLLVKYFNDFEGARHHFEEAIRFKPSYGTAYRNLSMLLMDKFNETQKAKEYYSKAVRLDTDNIDEAIAWYKNSIEDNPEFVGAYTNLAIALMRKNEDVDSAKMYLEKALSIKPDNDSANYNYAVLLLDYLDDIENACKHYKIAIENNPAQQDDRFDNICG